MPRKKKPTEPDPEALGEAWRGAMGDLIECSIALVWHRVKTRFNIDLSDREQATALQVYRLLRPVVEQGDVPLTGAMLSELVDANVPVVFRQGE